MKQLERNLTSHNLSNNKVIEFGNYFTQPFHVAAPYARLRNAGFVSAGLSSAVLRICSFSSCDALFMVRMGVPICCV